MPVKGDMTPYWHARVEGPKHLVDWRLRRDWWKKARRLLKEAGLRQQYDCRKKAEAVEIAKRLRKQIRHIDGARVVVGEHFRLYL